MAAIPQAFTSVSHSAKTIVVNARIAPARRNSSPPQKCCLSWNAPYGAAPTASFAAFCSPTMKRIRLEYDPTGSEVPARALCGSIRHRRSPSGLANAMIVVGLLIESAKLVPVLESPIGDQETPTLLGGGEAEALGQLLCATSPRIAGRDFVVESENQSMMRIDSFPASRSALYPSAQFA